MRVSRAAAMLALGVLVGIGCAEPDLTAIDDPATIDDTHLELTELDPSAWVDRYLPERAFNGYTLELYRRRVPMLIDMTGRVVHLWPRVRAAGRARLDSRGRLLVIGIDDLVKIYDWEGRLRWYYRLEEPGLMPHHDAGWTARGTVLVLAMDRKTHADLVREVDRSGRVVWEWRARDHLGPALSDPEREETDPTHINSVHELPPNRWFDSGDRRFRPGNILLSARNLDMVFVVDRDTGRVVWRYRRRLDRQHEAVMIPRGQLGEGLIVFFNNGLRNLHGYRRSEIQAVDPSTNRIAWSYRAQTFYSDVAGSQQPLPNGNLLISSSEGGRVFEVTPDREIVWQWTPPFLPMRPERYPYDHCPQLARLGTPVEVPVAPRRPRGFIDQGLHTFAANDEYDIRPIDGDKLEIVRPDVRCRELLIPPGPIIRLSYGLDRSRLGNANVEATFRFTVRELDGGDTRVLLSDTVSSGSDQLWRVGFERLEIRAFRRAELCIDVTAAGNVSPERASRIAAVENPYIYAADRTIFPEELRDRELSPQERAIREQQLRALGYIN